MIPRNLKHYGPYAHLQGTNGKPSQRACTGGQQGCVDRSGQSRALSTVGTVPRSRWRTHFRAELVEIIERLADVERWAEGHRNDVLARAIRGPLADLLPSFGTSESAMQT
ncbi:hypothetical protein AWB74_04874 [Caballeronia arvi]|uniref:Uncharacterized protein n=1 Tax=Caballeronia arvi TaxID=1777135 RepID=A0A158K5I0_9BURK|nr:hypothetical protein AWB74_04874 [Caballeronia arvi]